MKVLLVNPPTEHMIQTPLPAFVEEDRGCSPPLGLLYIASSLRGEGHDVEVIDSQAEKLDYAKLAFRVEGAEPDVVGITAMSFTLIDALNTAKIAKEHCPQAKVVLGGPHPTIYPLETVAFSDVDYAVVGEGELTMPLLLRSIGDGKSCNAAGVAYKDRGNPAYNPWREYICDLDTLPFPDRTLTPYGRYSSILARKTPITTMITSRGCPYKCVFCDRPQMGKAFRARSAKNVVDEMEECAGLGIKEILVYDDTFTVDRRRVLDICSEKRRRGVDIAFDIRARVNTVDAEVLGRLKDAGCERIHYGVESGNPSILEILRKGINLKQVDEAFRLTRKAGIETLAYFMIGSPTETKESVEETIDCAIRLQPDYAHFAVTIPFPATDLYRMALAEGVIKDDVWLNFAKNPREEFIPPVWEDSLRVEELKQYLDEAYKRFYVRPGYILKRIGRIRSPSELLRKTASGIRLLR